MEAVSESEAPVGWHLGDGERAEVGDEVFGHEGYRGRITGVDAGTGHPRISYESDSLAGQTLPLHPFRIRKAT